MVCLVGDELLRHRRHDRPLERSGGDHDLVGTQ
jgi:hypothetical protein